MRPSSNMRSIWVWSVALLPCGIIAVVLSLPLLAEELSEHELAEAAVEVWMSDRGLELGSNLDKQAFVVQVPGRDRLECLVAALAEVASHIRTQILQSGAETSGTALSRTSIFKARQSLQGFDIVHERTAIRTRQIGAAENKRQPTRSHEAMTLVQRNGELLCAMYFASQGTVRTQYFYPSHDLARRQSLEHDLMKAFVRDSFTYRFQDGEHVQCAFVFDTSPQQ